MNQKIVIGGLIAVIIVALGAFGYVRFSGSRPSVSVPVQQPETQTVAPVTGQNSQISPRDSQKPAAQTQISTGIKAQGANGGGTLSICLDKCGDGICQVSDPTCAKGDMNCICPETHANCPADCK